MMNMLLLAAAGHAAEPQCLRLQPVAGFENWGQPQGAVPKVGQEATLGLKPVGQVRFVPALARKPKAGAYGGYFPLTITKAGHYRVALSHPAWLDLVQKSARLRSADHEHGPTCSGIAKIVGYDLKPGRYWLQLSEASDSSIGVMVSSPAK